MSTQTTPGGSVYSYEQGRGAAVVSSDSVREHMKSAFPKAISGGKLPPTDSLPSPLPTPFVPDQPQLPFVGEPAVTQTKTSPRARTRKSAAAVPPPESTPTRVVEFITALGSIETRAYHAQFDDELLTILSPLAAENRFKPARGTEIEIKIAEGTFSCWCPGIHVDVLPYGFALSQYMIVPKEKESE